jgi:O-antigen ligase
MTENSNGQLEASAQERVDLWSNAWNSIQRSPIVGNGFATFQLGEHVDNLKDTHNWYVKVMVETGIIGLSMALFLLQQMLALSYRLFRRATDPLYQGLGLGLLLAVCSCMVANLFGDRWTYLEITALLWVLVAAAARASNLIESDLTPELTTDTPAVIASPYEEYRKKFARTPEIPTR